MKGKIYFETVSTLHQHHLSLSCYKVKPTLASLSHNKRRGGAMNAGGGAAGDVNLEAFFGHKICPSPPCNGDIKK